MALDHLSVERDDLAQFFIDVLRRLFLVVSHTLGDKSGQPFPITKIQTNIRNMNSGPTSIFGNEELALIDNEGLGSVSVPDFSDWIHP